MGQYVEEAIYNFTTSKALQKAYSDDMKDAISTTKDANALYKSGDWSKAETKFKSALTKFEKMDKGIREIPETKIPWLSLEDIVLFLPLINFVIMIATMIPMYAAEWEALQYSPAHDASYWEDVKRRFTILKEHPTWSKSMLLLALDTSTNYCSDMAAACALNKKMGKKVTAESYVYETLDDCINAIELMETPGFLSTRGSGGDVHLLEEYIKCYT